MMNFGSVVWLLLGLLVFPTSEAATDTKKNAITVEVWSTPSLDWDPESEEYKEGPNVDLFEAIEQVELALGPTGTIKWEMKQFIKDNKICPDLEDYNCINTQCINQGNYCLESPTDPAHMSQVTGKDLLRESLRRMCIWDIAKFEHNPALFLDYIFHFHQAKCDLEDYQPSCLNEVYPLANIDVTALSTCLKDSGGISRGENLLLVGLLHKEEDRGILQSSANVQDTLPIIYINDKPLPEKVLYDPAKLFDAVCDNIPVGDKPQACHEGLEDALQEQVNEEILSDSQDHSDTNAPETETEDDQSDLGEEALKEALKEEEEDMDPEEKEALMEEEEEIEKEEEEETSNQPSNQPSSQPTQTPTSASPTMAPTSGAPSASPTETDPLVLIQRANEQYQNAAAHITDMKYKPIANTTIVEFWTTPFYDWDSTKTKDDGSGPEHGPNKSVLQILRQLVIDFGNYVVFRPRAFLYSSEEVCGDPDSDRTRTLSEVSECIENHCTNHGRYCAKGTEDWFLTGKDMVEESLRRLCVAQVEPEKFFHYFVEYHKSSCDQQSSRDECIAQAFTNARIEQDMQEEIQSCMVKSGGLEEDQDNVLFDYLLEVQKLTWEYQETAYRKAPEDLPVVLIDQEQPVNLHFDKIYAKACAQLQLPPEDDAFPLCEQNLAQYANLFAINPDQIINREKQFEKDIGEEAPTDDELNINNGNHVPIVELWTSPILDWKSPTDSSDGPNIELFQKMKELVIGFGEDIIFRPQFYIYNAQQVCSVDEEGNRLVGKEKRFCINRNCATQGTYCDFAEGNENLSGIDLVEESMLRMCLWTTYGRTAGEDDAMKFFLYHEKYHSKKCHGAEKREDCAVEIMGEVKLDRYGLRHCIGRLGLAGTEHAILQDLVSIQDAKFFYHQLDPADLPIVMVNGVPLENGGTDLTVDELFEIICTEYPKTSKNDLPEICNGDMEENLGEDYNYTVAPSYKIAELEGKGSVSSSGSSSGYTTAPTEGEKGEETLLTSSPTGASFDTDSPTGASPETNSPTGLPTGAPSESDLYEPGTTTAKPVAGTTTTEPVLPQETTMSASASTITPASNAAATTSPWVVEASTTTPVDSSPLDIVTEKAAPEGEWGLNTAAESSKTSVATGTPSPTATAESKDPVETGIVDIEAPPFSEVDSLEGLDMELVTSAIDHMQALQQCGVDTAALIHKLMVLGAGSDTWKEEVAGIEADVPVFMSETCPHEEGADIMNRMTEFHKCSLFDLEELIETFPSNAMGVAMRCASAYSKLTAEEQEQGFIPEACIRTIEADGVLGRGLFGLYLYPDRTCPCFEALGKDVPECTADVWPIPINGVLLKTQSCLVAEYCQSLDGLCDKNLEILNRCLPSEDAKGSNIACGEVFEECKELYENVPPMLNAAPLPDACVRVAEGSKFYAKHVVERYDTFRHQCGNNLELWEGHTPIAEFEAFVTDGVNGINVHGFDFLSGIGGGFLLGIAFCIVFVIVRNIIRCVCNFFRRCCCCCRKKPNKRRPRTKDYDTVDTEGEDIPEYHD